MFLTAPSTRSRLAQEASLIRPFLLDWSRSTSKTLAARSTLLTHLLITQLKQPQPPARVRSACSTLTASSCKGLLPEANLHRLGVLLLHLPVSASSAATCL